MNKPYEGELLPQKNDMSVARVERPQIKRNYKDTVFRMLMNDEQTLLSVFNAVNKTNYTDFSKIKINTLENAIYMGAQNDVSFIFDFQLYLYEHQSSVNPNMPLRNLFYVSSLYEDLIRDKNIYSSRLVKVPAPHFIVFYNGIDEQPEQITLKLSDAFMMPEGTETGPELELKVRLININPGYNDDIVQKCRILFEYQSYVQKVREYHRSMSLEEAVEHCVDECIKNGILRDFLMKNKAEVIHMSIFEYDHERHMRMLQQEAFEDGEVRGQEIGKEIGYKESILSILSDRGDICNEIKERIMSETDIVKVQSWLKAAARVDSVEDFMQCLD